MTLRLKTNDTIITLQDLKDLYSENMDLVQAPTFKDWFLNVINSTLAKQNDCEILYMTGTEVGSLVRRLVETA